MNDGDDNDDAAVRQEIERERNSLVAMLHEWLEIPMLVLAFVWLALFIIEVIWGLTPLLELIGSIIWVAFIMEFALGFALAPKKTPYVKQNWLKALSLVAPAFRVFRIVRLVRLTRVAGLTRGLRLLRVLSSLNRGMRALSASMGRRGFGYVILLTMIVTLVSAAGMYAFENEGPDGRNFTSYGDALWWTSMIITTLGSDYWPQTPAGRILCFFLSLYSFAIFGYVTATLASFFLGSDADENRQLTGAVNELSKETAELRAQMQRTGNE